MPTGKDVKIDAHSLKAIIGNQKGAESMKEYPMTEEEFIKRVSELFMNEFKQIPDKDKEEFLESDDVQEFMKELYYGVCGDYEISGRKDAFSDEMLSRYPVYNLQLYF